MRVLENTQVVEDLLFVFLFFPLVICWHVVTIVVSPLGINKVSLSIRVEENSCNQVVICSGQI